MQALSRKSFFLCPFVHFLEHEQHGIFLKLLTSDEGLFQSDAFIIPSGPYFYLECFKLRLLP